MGHLEFPEAVDDMPTVPIEEIRIYEPFPKGYKHFELRMYERPEGFRQWRNFLWGFDLWFGPVPVVKTVILANVIVWMVLK